MTVLKYQRTFKRIKKLSKRLASKKYLECLSLIANRKQLPYKVHHRFSQSIRGGVLEDTFWSPLSLVKSLASKPQVLKNCPVLGSRTALFFESLKFCRSPEKIFWKPIFLEIAWKKILRPFFFLKTLAPVSLALSIPVPGLERVCPRKGCPWFWIFLCFWSCP